MDNKVDEIGTLELEYKRLELEQLKKAIQRDQEEIKFIHWREQQETIRKSIECCVSVLKINPNGGPLWPKAIQQATQKIEELMEEFTVREV